MDTRLKTTPKELQSIKDFIKGHRHCCPDYFKRYGNGCKYDLHITEHDGCDEIIIECPYCHGSQNITDVMGSRKEEK